jgi:drug/metabolite transporter (DMT)-like permease
VREILQYLWGIAATGLKIGWPLLITALGLAEVAFFGERDKIKTVGGWVIVFVGLLLLVWNLKR